MKTLKQSETITIKRSQINLNPHNPKKHSDEQVKKQLKNLKKVGYIGGIKWNKVTGNLIDGHRRIQAMDIHYKYDGSPETDYNVKVEAVEFDLKTEKEQMTYEALGNTKADYHLVAEYINDIDIQEVGLSDGDLSSILALTDIGTQPIIETMDDFIQQEDAEENSQGETYEDKRNKVKEMKQQIRENTIERQVNENAYLTLSFSSFEAKEIFCEIIGISAEERFAKGEDVLKIIE